MADDPRQGQFGRRWWDEPTLQGAFWERGSEKPPPRTRQRPAPMAFESQPPQLPLSNKQNMYNSRSAAARPRRDSRMVNKPGGARNHSIAARSKTAPRHKRGQAPSFKL